MYIKKKKKILIASRPHNKIFSGFYEFPGGKLKKNEFLLCGLEREILEELSIRINRNKVIFLKDYLIKRRGKEIHLNFFLCNEWAGEIKPMELQDLKWVKLSDILKYKMLTSNKKIIDSLCYLL